ncbi:MAG TPA: hypothetical protein VFU22_09880, partial [Roseiflexaceae bacterium]|nr:hypothetical protein [Roseiflexaceae bacterium]
WVRGRLRRPEPHLGSPGTSTVPERLHAKDVALGSRPIPANVHGNALDELIEIERLHEEVGDAAHDLSK